MTKLQRGTVFAFALAVLGGFSFLITAFVSEARVIEMERIQDDLSNQGYRVVYSKESNEDLSDFHLAACQDMSDFKLVDKYWKPANSDSFSKILCK